MKKKPFFSVIVPAHNSADYIQKCLGSIRQQTFKDYELIVVCDSCTDFTEYAAEQFWPEKVIKTDFGMDGLARNAGIEAAEGEWLVFLDDDDWWIHEYVLEELHREAVGNRELLVFDFIWKNHPEIWPGYCRNSNQMNIAVWSKAFRRSLIGDTRFPAIPFTSDEPFMNEILAKDPKVFITHQLMYYYNYLRKGSQTEIHARPDGAVLEA